MKYTKEIKNSLIANGLVLVSESLPLESFNSRLKN